MLHIARLFLRLFLGLFGMHRFAHVPLRLVEWLTCESSPPLEVLNGTFVLLGLRAGGKSAEVAAFARAWIDLPRVEPILTGF
jgi:hypothetical protein